MLVPVVMMMMMFITIFAVVIIERGREANSKMAPIYGVPTVL